MTRDNFVLAGSTRQIRCHGPRAAGGRAPVTRRQVLTHASAYASGLILGKYGRARAATTGYPFALGVASGSPAPDGFVLWTRLAPTPLAPDGSGGLTGPVPVTWEIATDDGMRNVVQRGSAEADDRFAHSVHVEAGGLEPNRPYWYRFAALGEQSQIGRTRTAPAPGADLAHLRFAFASCSNWELGYFSAYRHMAAENPDLIIFLGDYIYEYTIGADQAGRTVRKHDGPTATDIISYRNRYALYRTDPDLQALHAAAPCLVTWDDHEVENDYASEWPQDMQVTAEAFLRRRAAAYQAYYEHMPLRPASIARDGALSIHDRVRFGKMVTFHVLDGRQYRSQQPCPVPPSRRGHVAPDSCTERTDANRSLLGHEQERWLFDGFKRADTSWNVMAQNQLVASLRQKSTTGVIGHWTEGWDGYPACRQRILEAISQTRLSNPVFLGGDLHSFWTTDLKADFKDPSSRTIATEFVGTSITSDGPPHELFVQMLPENPHVHYFESRHRGYAAIDLTADRMETRFQVISDRRDPGASLLTLKRFIVENGKPGAIAA